MKEWWRQNAIGKNAFLGQQCTASFFCVAFWQFLGYAQKWAASYNFCFCLAVVWQWSSNGEADVNPKKSVRFVFYCAAYMIERLSILVFFFFDFRVLGQQCKAYFSSTAFQRVFFRSFLWSLGPTCTYVRNSRQTTKYTFTIWSTSLLSDFFVKIFEKYLIWMNDKSESTYYFDSWIDVLSTNRIRKPDFLS